MTNQEAIEKLKIYVDTVERYPQLLGKLAANKEVMESLECYKLAITALEKQESIRDGKWIHDNVPVCCLACPTCEGKHTCAYYLSECVGKQVSPGTEDKDEFDITSD